MDISTISVIVPTKNEENNLPVFLSSLPSEVQLILIDASADKTPDLALALRKKNIIVHRNSARIAEARNIGARLAQTEWLLFSDSDVIFANDYFSRLASLPPIHGALYGAKRSTGQYAEFYRSFSRWQSRLDRIGIPAVSGSNLLVERKVFDQVGGFNQELLVNEDTEFGYRIKRSGYPVRFDSLLSVIAFDHRRLHKGTFKKNFHTLVRCTFIYFNIFPGMWRNKDWGYWSGT